jgi:hypothetical protein
MQPLPRRKKVRKLGLEQFFVLGTVVWVFAASAASSRADLSLFFYNAATGDADTGYVSRDGTYANLQSYTGFLTGWTHITGTDDGLLLFYNATTGDADTGYVSRDGTYANLRSYTGFLTGSTHITGVGGGLLLFYNATTGDAHTATSVATAPMPTSRPIPASLRAGRISPVPRTVCCYFTMPRPETQAPGALIVTARIPT